MANKVIYSDPEGDRLREAVARARALREAGMEARPGGQYVGRVFVGGNSPLSALGQIVQTWIGNRSEKEALDKLDALEAQREQQAMEHFKNMPGMYEERDIPAPTIDQPAQLLPMQSSPVITEPGGWNSDKTQADDMFRAHVDASREMPSQVATPSITPGEYDLSPMTATAEPQPDVAQAFNQEVAAAVAAEPTRSGKERVLKNARQYADEMMRWNVKGLGIKHPLAQTMAMKGMEQVADFPTKMAEQEAKYAERMDEIQAKIQAGVATARDKQEFQMMMAKNNEQMRRDIAAQSNRTRMDIAGMGNQTRMDIAAMNAANKRDLAGAKVSAKDDKVAAGSTQANDIIDQMILDFGSLKNKGGITSSKENNVGQNFGAWAASTGVGQTAGKVFGTAEQSLRNQITSNTRRLATAVKNATGMSAQEMNSNVELQTMLNSLANLEGDYESNITILNRLREFINKQNSRGSQGNPSSVPTNPLSDDDLVKMYRGGR
jgi:hypothetical protein